MSDEGEKTCPLCAEEMDLTDQQLKPCKCGYEICVWCWHHIMDMAEKDHTEGRCPACRTPYNKEKIVGTASKCDRLVAEMGVEKKQKSQKGKTKTSEGRKQLSSVRVIQRNLVYIVGIPLNLADEDLLQRKEYFGQYGKVLKVSISRTAAGAIQHFANNTCSVYITYSKEEEAVRSIQSVHGFVLEGSPLRACFGTTKYCHAWLRNVPCTNPDCLYLHEFGSQEDSFSKDEVVSANSRGRVQQITGATNDMQRRSGNVLPPPAEDYNNNNSSWEKPISKSTTNNPANSIKVSPPNSSSGRSVTLPPAASWGIRSLNSQPPAANAVVSNGPTKQKVDNEIVKKHSEESHSLKEKGKLENTESRKVSNLLKDKNKSINMEPDFSSSSEISGHLTTADLEKDLNVVADEVKIQNLSSQMSLVTIDKNLGLQNLPHTSPPNKSMGSSPQQSYVSINGCLDPPLMDQNLEKGPPHTFHNSMSPLVAQTSPPSNKSMGYSPQNSYVSSNGCLDPPLMDQKLEKIPPHTFNSSNGHPGDMNQKGKYEYLGESSIISNILSMEFDPWDESLTSPQNLAKLFGENDKQEGSHRVSSSRKTQNSNQSRFSFAREDECIDQRSNLVPNHQNFGSDFVTSRDVYLDKYNNGNGFSSFSFEESDNFAISHSPMSTNKVSVSRAPVSAPPGFSGLSRAPPPGFNSHERMEQTFDNLSGNYMFDTSSLRKAHNGPAPVNSGSIDDLELMDPAILAVGGRVPGVFNSSPDLNPRSSFPSHLSSFENDSRLQLLMQRSFAPPQNQRFTELTNGYGMPSRIVEQSLPNYQQPRSSLMSNSHWNGWNEVQSGNDIAMAEYLRNERLGFNKYYSGYEDTKFRMPNSGDLYNRFGI